MKPASPHPRIRQLSIPPTASLVEVLKRMDALEAKLLLVMDADRFLSVVSIGDIQRAIIRNVSLDTPVARVLRPTIRVARDSEPFEVVRRRMLEHRTEFMPVVNEQNELLAVHFWDDVFAAEERMPGASLAVPVVIMAGGKGERLKPLTHIIPKPLIPIRDKPILEEILDRFHACGVTEFYLSVNYKAEMIEQYLATPPRPYHLHYFREDRPLGTAGSLHLLQDRIRSTFFVSNCDILVEHDYHEILRYHRENRNEITAVAALQIKSVPYGVFSCDQDGLLTEFREKPDVTLLVNVGMYVLEPGLLADIPRDRPFHLTHLIQAVRDRQGRVGVFPIREGDWLDIGEWKEYFDAISRHRGGRSPEHPQ